ncbi:hypothetical protein Rsub_10970 [Raphidocelis subcapitata]|uniref:Uncharacterized protein n=1 Tax=Raphidocelis subcapitata TaxID=307507 RepID=A0A2V0PLS4_9CHLO|nr:hypothetical protein Rsub_10970 [Raphidocelis subcapitata]|eukprot:GBF98307.1 hypothetical protein Rsub_10970 [Raphidocelis subcapitata]
MCPRGAAGARGALRVCAVHRGGVIWARRRRGAPRRALLPARVCVVARCAPRPRRARLVGRGARRAHGRACFVFFKSKEAGAGLLSARARARTHLHWRHVRAAAAAAPAGRAPPRTHRTDQRRAFARASAASAAAARARGAARPPLLRPAPPPAAAAHSACLPLERLAKCRRRARARAYRAQVAL